jgi:hypothetical protein
MKLLKKINSAALAVNLNLLAIALSLKNLPKYFSDRNRFIKYLDLKKWSFRSYPMLLDNKSEAASLGEYFWQDLFVAKKIIKKNPIRHIDIGSRIDGFIAHLACVRQVEIFDIRPLTRKIENVKFKKIDITNIKKNYKNVADCVSCLHTLEHIGLGRYGDNIDIHGWKKSLESIISIVKPRGLLWLSVPIGIQSVVFNAHRIFNPVTIIDEATKFEMKLINFYYLTDLGMVKSKNFQKDIQKLSKKKYGLGIFLFFKKEKKIN